VGVKRDDITRKKRGGVSHLVNMVGNGLPNGGGSQGRGGQSGGKNVGYENPKKNWLNKGKTLNGPSFQTNSRDGTPPNRVEVGKKKMKTMGEKKKKKTKL